MKNINSYVLCSILSLLSQVAYAEGRFDSLDFYPNVEIFSPTSLDALEIRLEKKHYEANYDQVFGRFDPLKIKFDVISKNSTKIDYALKLKLSSHYCKNDGDETSEKELLGVELKLDGYEFSIEGESKEISYSTDDKYTHSMTMESPLVEMTEERQMCYGVIGISAELNEGKI
ncbi:hypothetical protein HGP28_02755 [Vibrio sp. SM6]|uniref:Uncharacterized protein n=1 Tax=Vibrio agarilyticus TaxID=2726741 RepID=A0A7X8TNF7_9VIBR|nr:hypothetical protein [Vibrio agarilyticus]NLS11809.1 hypothetical protein [Vibrio agarilyticus]